MTTAFQSVIDNATTISINKRRTVGQTVARNGAVKSTSFGGQVWQFQVELPSGPRYSLYRSTIEKLEALDRTTVGQIQFNAAGHSYISGYLGNLSNIANINVTHVSGNTVTINSGASGLAVGQFIFKAGDIIQLGASGSVYSVAADVAHNGTTVTLNRPVRDGAGSYTLRVGPACVFDVICVQFPDWTIFGYDQVQWSGPFVFAEVI
jgi:hypothetical protein